MADEDYPDDTIRPDHTVEYDEQDNTPPGTGPRTVDAGADGGEGGPETVPQP